MKISTKDRKLIDDMTKLHRYGLSPQKALEQMKDDHNISTEDVVELSRKAVYAMENGMMDEATGKWL